MKLQTGIKLSLLLCVMITTPVMAHSGRTNADGCHTNRKTGEYHCHGSKSRRVDYYGQDAQRNNQAAPATTKSAKSYSKKINNGGSKSKTGTKRGNISSDGSAPHTITPPPDMRAQCANSKNLNAYWESVTARCLERNTGRELITP
jgi:hypothetical protein